MSSFTSNTASLVIGIAATVLASWYYFRKSVDKRLAIDIQFSTSLLRGIDPQVKRELDISYRDTTIEDMAQLQFLVMNQGQRAIRDLIEPLTVRLPSTATVLDASIIHIYPEGRTVGIEATAHLDGTTVLRFPFPLLNHGEGFIVRLLMTGTLEARQLQFQIAADDLPPILELTGWGVKQYGTTPRASILGLLLPFLVMASGGAVLSVTSKFVEVHPGAWPIPWSNFQPTWTETGTILLAGLAGVFVFLVGALLTVHQDGRPFSNRRPSLPLPPHLRPPAWIQRDGFGRVPDSHAERDRSNRLV